MEFRSGLYGIFPSLLAGRKMQEKKWFLCISVSLGKGCSAFKHLQLWANVYIPPNHTWTSMSVLLVTGMLIKWNRKKETTQFKCSISECLTLLIHPMRPVTADGDVPITCHGMGIKGWMGMAWKDGCTLQNPFPVPAFTKTISLVWPEILALGGAWPHGCLPS